MQRAAVTTFTEVQWADFAENSNSLNIWSLATFSLEERDKEKQRERHSDQTLRPDLKGQN